MRVWKRISALAISLATVATLVSCSTQDQSSDSAIPTSTRPLEATAPQGSCEVDFRKTPLRHIGAGENVSVTGSSEILYVTHDVEESATITATGNGTCIMITGDIGKNVTITSEGSHATVFILGAVDTSARISVGGWNSVLWVSRVSSMQSLPRISVEGARDCVLYLRDGRVAA